MNTHQASTYIGPDALNLFQNRGYHIHGRLFSPEEIDALTAACEGVCQGTYETGRPPDSIYWRPGMEATAIRKIDNCWKANQTIFKAVTSERLGHVAAQLLGAPSIRLWHDQLSYKPGNGGKVITWHQDWMYWQMISEPKTITCWIALDDVEPESGPMVYLEGSHKLGLQPKPSRISGDDPQKPTVSGGPPLKEVPILIQSGQVVFHHGLMLHGSYKNWSLKARRAMVSHVMSGECTYRHVGRHICEKMMKTYSEYPGPGEPFRGPQFPQMWPGSIGDWGMGIAG